MEELRKIYSRKPEEEEKEAGDSTATSSRSPVRKQGDDYWQETLQRLLTAQELGNSYVRTVATVSGSGLNVQSMVSVVQQTVEQLIGTKQEVSELRSHWLIQVQQHQEDMKYCRKYQERLSKAQQDLNCVSEMLDSCTLMDLGSEPQTSRLLEHFSQARPHFILEALLHSEPASPLTDSTGFCGRNEAELGLYREKQQQIRTLLKMTSALKTDICTAVQSSDCTCFQVEQLEARLLSLDSLCILWLNAAAQREEKLRRELLARQLSDDIDQLCDSFKELKKHFSNLRFNYLKRNNRTRNLKATRNQLQQVELYEEKLRGLRRRLQDVMYRLGSEVKDGAIAREVEDAVNELQRQMGEFEQSVSEHQNTLEMTSRLQQAMEEYQFWCEGASATIARVSKFSLECRSTEAISVLCRQFEKFIWPTVPQQEERISQITELAVRLHGVEEGRRYIEKTVSKHSVMVESIRELSARLMKLETKLKVESGEQQQKGRGKEEAERRTERGTREEDEEKEKKLSENRKMKKKEQMENRNTEEEADVYELKETGYTPELTEPMEDSQSNDEYECASPDDISLPPLAETPESNIVHSDTEDSFCFSHSVHVSQYSHQYRAQSEHSGPGSATGAIRQQTESIQTEGNPTTPTILHSHTRLRAESSLFVQNPLKVPDLLTSTLCSILGTGEPNTANLPEGNTEPSFPSGPNSVHQSNTPDTCYIKDNNVPEDGSPSQIAPLLIEYNSQYKQPHSSAGTHSRNTQTVPYKTKTLPQTVPQTDPVPLGADHSQSPPLPQSSYCPQAFDDADPDLLKHKALPQHTSLLKHSTTFPQIRTVICQENTFTQSIPDSEHGLNQAINPPQAKKETSPVSKHQRYDLTSISTVTSQQTAYSQSLPSDSHCTLTEASSSLRSQQENHFTQASRSLPDVYVPNPSEPSSMRNISTSSSRFSSKQSHQRLCSLHESLTSTCSQQRVHDPGRTHSSPARPTAPRQLKAQILTLAQQANPHVTPPSSPSHLLTPEQDADICQPVAICEEIRLTPQILGPPLPAPSPPSKDQAESLPQGKASKPGPPCFTRPLSKATVMEGSPVMLEVEVMAHPEPTLTWFKDGEVSATSTDRALARKEKKHFLLDSDSGLFEAPATNPDGSWWVAGNSSSCGEKWLVAKVWDIISVDWQTWFGTMCALLWLFYLILF
uniref:Ig-like domain-containing protein n=1 Tax=Monopterus albus TaxID=43700 RepID=A0A3Q3JC78_MONAL